MIKNYNSRVPEDVYALCKYYKERNLSTAYVLPMAGLSSFDFHGHLVDTYLDLKNYYIYAKCTNPLYSLTDNINLVHCFRATNNEETEVYYYLQFEIPDDFKKYYDLFLQNKLNHLDPVSAEILRIAKLLTVVNGECKWYYFGATPGVITQEEADKKNALIDEMIYSLWYNAFEKDGDHYIYNLYEIRWKQIKELNIMTKMEFLEKVLNKEIDLSQKIDFEKLDIENELKIYHHVSVYNPDRVYTYQ
jgi:hypothetical protein